MRFENLTNYFNSRRYDFSALALALPGLRQTSAIPANKDGPKHQNVAIFDYTIFNLTAQHTN